MYEIIIKKTETITKPCGKDWKVIEQRPVTKEDVENAFGAEESYDGKMKDVYGYTPGIDKPIEEEREVLRQTVEELDLATVIKAVNNL